MNKKFIFGILVLGVLVTVSFVSAGLFSKATITGNAIGDDGWSDWLDIDNPSGNGDYELLSSRNIRDQVCEKPSAIECRTKNGKIDSSDAGQKVSCDVDRGFSCLNRNNGGSIFNPTCEDYEVRFYCGDKVEESDCTDSDGGKNFYLKGKVSYEKGVVEDVCNSAGTAVTEAFCKDAPEFGSSLGVAVKSCESGICKDGACVRNNVSSCGNGILESGEQCDDSNNVKFDGCSSTCQIEEGYSCSGSPSLCTRSTGSDEKEVTYQGVLYMLGKCQVMNPAINTSAIRQTLRSYCESIGQECVSGFYIDRQKDFSEKDSIFPLDCSSGYSYEQSKRDNYFVFCCPISN